MSHGNGTAPNMLGLLNETGTLTRAIATNTALDCLKKSFNDLRVGSSFATADLVAMHPTTSGVGGAVVDRNGDVCGRLWCSPRQSRGDLLRPGPLPWPVRGGSGSGRRDEVTHQVGEAVRFIEVREVAGSLE